MDNFTGEMFADCEAYEARMENEVPAYEDCDTWDPIMGDADEWPETDDDFAADYYGEEEFA